uniref:ATP-dependent Clp protease proteolytic subunit n=1 Tax=Paphiopedilum intaniae TaxID=451005 RepID=A0A9E9IX55_9ASPA|nr:clp protease proteolytic subunit [Paphiopedilum philippinense]YP_010178688.1 clp protease proteolytic subunit [Paphiopedilum kolopakingii]YP_010602686.1 Clp protease proteolytic subunit [Paphiopedilum intaniae]YP_010603749.1 Clp protease proteolytic subunit [Paphiopedilum randsii]YP_010603827.1 Clp protease proteolytic subunit [Paphiopedilum rothschildianum]YP_010603979.1 Clp protease proteolytic subunit [Paphiopedilum sanderianum]YP_010604209.1 Clp protease proteolytic subunit [Paphiopedi
MPVGVPKVPFRSPGEEDAVWVDLYNRLHRERLLFLGQEVDSEISNQLAGLMVYLSIEDATRDLYLFINSPGGWVIPGIAIYDTMQFVVPDVHTICMGLAASMGSFILVGGEITKRLAFPHARVMIHQPASSFYEAQAGEFILEAEELLKLRENLTKVYVQRTYNPLWVISEDMERDVFMSATEAQAHGIVDLVAVEDENTGDYIYI